jgi:hypothetical protein
VNVLSSLTADEGYFSVEQACYLQGERVRVIIGDPHEPKRRRDKQPRVVRQVLSKAKRAVKSKSARRSLGLLLCVCPIAGGYDTRSGKGHTHHDLVHHRQR